MRSAAETVTPFAWDQTFSGTPNLCSAGAGLGGALLRRWAGTASAMEQPPLDHHYLCQHLGGAKSVVRRGAAATYADAALESVSIIPAGAGYSWTTRGPIGFAHLYLDPRMVDRVVNEEFDRDPRDIELVDCVAARMPLISALMSGLVAQLQIPSFASRLLLDTLLHNLVVQLLSESSTLTGSSRPARHSIAPRRLRRVFEYIETNLASEIALDDLASVAGSSRYHFARAFRDATGLPPYRYVVHRRVDAAKGLLIKDRLSVAEVAKRCGFNSAAQLAVMFRQVLGTSPGRFRREH